MCTVALRRLQLQHFIPRSESAALSRPAAELCVQSACTVSPVAQAARIPRKIRGKHEAGRVPGTGPNPA